MWRWTAHNKLTLKIVSHDSGTELLTTDSNTLESRLSIFLSITCFRKKMCKTFHPQNVSIIIANQSMLFQQLNVGPITITSTKICFSINKWVTRPFRPARQFQQGPQTSSLATFSLPLACHLSAGQPDRPVTICYCRESLVHARYTPPQPSWSCLLTTTCTSSSTMMTLISKNLHKQGSLLGTGGAGAGSPRRSLKKFHCSSTWREGGGGGVSWGRPKIHWKNKVSIS